MYSPVSLRLNTLRGVSVQSYDHVTMYASRERARSFEEVVTESNLGTLHMCRNYICVQVGMLCQNVCNPVQNSCILV